MNLSEQKWLWCHEAGLELFPSWLLSFMLGAGAGAGAGTLPPSLTLCSLHTPRHVPSGPGAVVLPWPHLPYQTDGPCAPLPERQSPSSGISVMTEKALNHPALINHSVRVPLISIVEDTSEKDIRDCLFKQIFLISGIDWRIISIFKKNCTWLFFRDQNSAPCSNEIQLNYEYWKM